MLADRGLRLSWIPFDHVAPDHPWITDSRTILQATAMIWLRAGEFFQPTQVLALGEIRSLLLPDLAQLNGFIQIAQAIIETVGSYCRAIDCSAAYGDAAHAPIFERTGAPRRSTSG